MIGESVAPALQPVRACPESHSWPAAPIPASLRSPSIARDPVEGLPRRSRLRSADGHAPPRSRRGACVDEQVHGDFAGNFAPPQLIAGPFDDHQVVGLHHALAHQRGRAKHACRRPCAPRDCRRLLPPGRSDEAFCRSGRYRRGAVLWSSRREIDALKPSASYRTAGGCPEKDCATGNQAPSQA